MQKASVAAVGLETDYLDETVMARPGALVALGAILPCRRMIPGRRWTGRRALGPVSPTPPFSKSAPEASFLRPLPPPGVGGFGGQENPYGSRDSRSRSRSYSRRSRSNSRSPPRRRRARSMSPDERDRDRRRRDYSRSRSRSRSPNRHRCGVRVSSREGGGKWSRLKLDVSATEKIDSLGRIIS